MVMILDEGPKGDKKKDLKEKNSNCIYAPGTQGWVKQKPFFILVLPLFSLRIMF